MIYACVLMTVLPIEHYCQNSHSCSGYGLSCFISSHTLDHALNVFISVFLKKINFYVLPIAPKPVYSPSPHHLIRLRLRKQTICLNDTDECFNSICIETWNRLEVVEKLLVENRKMFSITFLNSILEVYHNEIKLQKRQ